MEKVREKLDVLNADFEDLYYDKDEIINQYSFEQGIAQGIKQKQREMATSMLKDNVSIETIVKYTGLTKEELDSMK